MGNLLGLFPIPVSIYTLDRALNEFELDTLINQPQISNAGNTRSKNSYILNDSNLNLLKNFIEDCIEDYFVNIHDPASKVSLRITQSWTNVTLAGQYHHNHTHANSLVSGVFYIQSNPSIDKIYFYNNNIKYNHNQLKIISKNYNQYNSISWWLEAIPNTLIMFPSTLEHGVGTTNNDAKPRISLSFNTFPIGKFGSEEELTELYI